MKLVVVELDVSDNQAFCRVDYPDKESIYRGGPRLSFYDGDGQLHSCRSPTQVEIIRLEAARSTRAIAHAVVDEQERREMVRQRQGKTLADGMIEGRGTCSKEPPPSRIPPPRTTWELLHHLWSKAVGTPEYDKKQWLTLEAIILRSGRADDDAASYAKQDDGNHYGYELPGYTYPLEWARGSG
jgi:hypothetical protein